MNAEKELKNLVTSLIGVEGAEALRDHGLVVLTGDTLAYLLAGVESEREACAKLAETEPFVPGTLTGTRQDAMRKSIAAKIRARPGLREAGVVYLRMSAREASCVAVALCEAADGKIPAVDRRDAESLLKRLSIAVKNSETR